jgi:HupE/UreJ protein
MTPVRAFFFAVALGALGAGSAHAHTGGSNGYAAIAVDGPRIRYTLTLWPAALPPGVAQEIRGARAGDAAARDRLLAVVREKVALAAQGRRCDARAGSVRPGAAEGESLTLVVEFACGGPVRELLVRDDLFDVLGADYHTLARIDGLGPPVQFAFQPDARETRVTAEGGRGVASFVRLGVEHILGGWDHLLFLLALLLRGGGWWSLVRIVTAFTLAHSVTLALAVLNVVAMPARLVEAVIALSIALVAAENLVTRPVVSRRWVVSFCFGLVHGFGFSSALREAGLPADGLVLSLLGFNLGVELGQALVIAAALPLLALVRRSRWERRVIWGSSAAMLVLGVVLFVERTLL